MGASIPRTLDDVDAAWVDAALKEGGALKSASVSMIEPEPIGVGVGLLGDLLRLQLHYDGDDEDAPSTVIVKLPSHHEANRAQGMLFGFYEREIRFYRDVAPGVRIRVPRCYWSGMDPDAGLFALLLEDFSTLQMADQVAGVSPDRAMAAVRSLARFHADWWETDDLESLEWMPYSNGPVTMQAVGVYERGWEPFLEHFGGGLSQEARLLGERVRDHFAGLLEQLGQSPRTIVHTDFRLDNLFFGHGDEVGIIDWQLSTRGRGVYDVAYLLCQSMTVEQRRAHEMDVLKAWHDTLVAEGVADYSWADAVEDYTRSAMICLVIPVAAGNDMDLGNERGKALVAALADRAFTAAIDLDAGRLLPG